MRNTITTRAIEQQRSRKFWKCILIMVPVLLISLLVIFEPDVAAARWIAGVALIMMAFGYMGRELGWK